jgi:hypothetical protein
VTRPFIFAGLLAAAVLAACNGGSATAPPFNTGAFVSPSPTPPILVALRWTGATHSTTQSAARHVLDVGSSLEPIELAIDSGAGTLIRGSGATDGIVQLVATQGGTPVPVPQPSPGAISISNGAVAVTSPLPAPSGSPTAGPLNIATVNSRQQVGSTTFTVQLPDGTTRTDTVDVSQSLPLECPAGNHSDSRDAFRFVGGIMTASVAANADVSMSGPRCTDKSTAGTVVHFPYGYQPYTAVIAFGSILNAQPFTSAGTSITLADLTAASVNGSIGSIVFKTQAGDYGKFRISTVGCESFVSASLCDAGGPLAGPAEFGPAGIFPR